MAGPQESQNLLKDLEGLALHFLLFTMGRVPKPPPTKSPKGVVNPSDEDERENENTIVSE